MSQRPKLLNRKSFSSRLTCNLDSQCCCRSHAVAASASDHDITPEDTPSTTQIQFLLVASRRFAAIYMGLVWANNFAFKHEKAHERCSPLSSELVFTQVSRTCRLRRMPIPQLIVVALKTPVPDFTCNTVSHCELRERSCCADSVVWLHRTHGHLVSRRPSGPGWIACLGAEKRPLEWTIRKQKNFLGCQSKGSQPRIGMKIFQSCLQGPNLRLLSCQTLLRALRL